MNRVGPGRRRHGDGAAYAQLVGVVAVQLAAQLADAPDWESVVVMPVVGFGDQYRDVLERTLGLLAGVTAGRRLILALVNRPQSQPPDGAAALLHEAARRPGARRGLVVCEVELGRRPRMGELRQLAVDALESVVGPLAPDTPLLVCDDDLVVLPDDALAARERAVRGGAGLAVGPVLFDDPLRPMCLYGGLYGADLFRAVLGQELLSAWQQPTTGGESRAPAVLESLVFSSNLAVRRDVLGAAGGFRDLNEITWLARDVLTAPGLDRPLQVEPPVDGVGSAADDLRARAVRVSSRRALAAWRGHGQPTVAQWRALRFTASRIDPARQPAPLTALPRPVRDLPNADRVAVAHSFARAAATTCDYLDPPPELAVAALCALGLSSADVEVRRDATTEWQVVVRRPDGFLHWLERTQADELPRAEVALARPAQPPALEAGSG